MRTLVILAAGMGSRFGAPKQLSPVGPNGETILQYNAHDAAAAGFGRIVAVTRAELREVVQRQLADACGAGMDLRTVVQSVPARRAKPLGSADAVLAAAAEVAGPFAVANSDDIYGPSAFEALGGRMASSDVEATVVAYRLADTIPAAGRVTRALLRVRDDVVTDLVETPGIGRGADGRPTVADGRPLSGREWASMNLWGLPPWVMEHIRTRVDAFRRTAPPDDEIYLPEVVGALARSDELTLRWVESGEVWAGITNPDDLDTVRAFLRSRRPQPLSARSFGRSCNDRWQNDRHGA